MTTPESLHTSVSTPVEAPRERDSRLRGTLLPPAEALDVEITPVDDSVEDFAEQTDWSSYLDRARTVLSEIDDKPGSVSVRITNPYDEETPHIIAQSPNGTTDLRHLVRKGAIIARNRPREGEVREYEVVKGPSLPTVGREEDRMWRMSVREKGGKGTTSIGLPELFAPANPDNGRSWRLVIPEALPESYRPA